MGESATAEHNCATGNEGDLSQVKRQSSGKADVGEAAAANNVPDKKKAENQRFGPYAPGK